MYIYIYKEGRLCWGPWKKTQNPKLSKPACTVLPSLAESGVLETAAQQLQGPP